MEIGVETKRLGYEYRCRVGMDEEILSVYPRNPRYPPPTETELVVEVQTNFILKPISSSSKVEEIVDSERFATVLMVSESVDLLCKRTTYRLEEYWFSIQESERIIGEVFSFGKRMAAAGGGPRVIPIVLGIDVCTVQLEGESLDGAKDRMIKPDCLMPIKLWGLSLVPSVRRPMKIDIDVRIKLIGLPKQRVEDVDKASAQMEVCPICFRPPTHGAVLTHLYCNPNHIFHNHCIVRWLILKKSCPMCRFEIPIQRNTGISESGVV